MKILEFIAETNILLMVKYGKAQLEDRLANLPLDETSDKKLKSLFFSQKSNGGKTGRFLLVGALV